MRYKVVETPGEAAAQLYEYRTHASYDFSHSQMVVEFLYMTAEGAHGAANVDGLTQRAWGYSLAEDVRQIPIALVIMDFRNGVNVFKLESIAARKKTRKLVLSSVLRQVLLKPVKFSMAQSFMRTLLQVP